jgi:hypothetical protein
MPIAAFLRFDFEAAGLSAARIVTLVLKYLMELRCLNPVIESINTSNVLHSEKNDPLLLKAIDTSKTTTEMRPYSKPKRAH